MSQPTAATRALREALASRKREIDGLLTYYGATNARLFGSVARGDARPESDIDIIVDLTSPGHRTLMRLGGLSEGLREILHRPVDVATPGILRDGVARTAAQDAIPL